MSENTIYVYETAYAGIVLIKHQENEPSVIETTPSSDITAAELIKAAKDLGYNVVHWRWANYIGDGERADGCLVRVYEDGTEADDTKPLHDIVLQITRNFSDHAAS